MASYFEEMGWAPLEDGQAPNHFLHWARLMRDYNMFEEIGVTAQLPPPTSKAAIEHLPTETIKEEGDQCPVCLKAFEVNTEVKMISCKHKFHAGCILPWLHKTSTCPVCRYELPTDDENYELYKKEKIRAKQRETEIEDLHNSMFS